MYLPKCNPFPLINSFKSTQKPLYFVLDLFIFATPMVKNIKDQRAGMAYQDFSPRKLRGRRVLQKGPAYQCAKRALPAEIL